MFEGYFNQLKYYLKSNEKIYKFDELEIEVKKIINNIKEINYQNYFNNAYCDDIYINRCKYQLCKSSFSSMF